MSYRLTQEELDTLPTVDCPRGCGGRIHIGKPDSARRMHLKLRVVNYGVELDQDVVETSAEITRLEAALSFADSKRKAKQIRREATRLYGVLDGLQIAISRLERVSDALPPLPPETGGKHKREMD